MRDFEWRTRETGPGPWSDSEGICTPVKRNARRAVYRIDTPAGRFFVKHSVPNSLFDAVKTLWRCNAKREYEAGLALEAAGVPVVRYSAWGTRGTESLLVSRALDGTLALPDAWRQVRGQPDRRRKFLRVLADLTGSLRQAGVAHPDLHGENVLVDPSQDPPAMHLVDVCGVATGMPDSPALRVGIFRPVLGVAGDLKTGELRDFLMRAGGFRSLEEARATWQYIRGTVAAEQRKRWPGMRKRLLGNSSLCSRHDDAEGRWLLAKPFAADEARAALLRHRQNLREDRDVLKRDDKRSVTRVRVGSESYVVKEFRGAAARGPWRGDRDSWLNAAKLRLTGVPAAANLAWLRGKDGNGYIVQEDLGSRTLMRALRETPPAGVRNALLEAAGRLAGRLHAGHVEHNDLNPNNIIVKSAAAEGTFPLGLVDVDKVRLHAGGLPTARVRRNLKQLLEDICRLAPRCAVLRLVACYREAAFASKGRLRDVLPAEIPLGPPPTGPARPATRERSAHS